MNGRTAVRLLGTDRWWPIYTGTLSRLRAGALPGFQMIGDLIVFPTGELGEVRIG